MLSADAFSAIYEASSINRSNEKIYNIEEVKKVTNRSA